MKQIGDLDVFPLCLGGNVFGWTAGKERSFEILDAYAAAGGNFVDTADSYMASAPGNRGGESETIIGEWTETRGNRDDVVIATKVGRHPSAGAGPGEHQGRRGRLAPAAPHPPHRPLLHALRRPVRPHRGHHDHAARARHRGKVRQIGCPTSSPTGSRSRWSSPNARGRPPTRPSSRTTTWSRCDTYEGPRRDLAERYGLAAVPYYGLASGFLTGKYRPGANVDSVRAERAAAHLETERGRRVLAALDLVAEEQGTAVATVALAWLAAQPTVAAPSPAPAPSTSPAPHRGRPHDPDRGPAPAPHRGVRVRAVSQTGDTDV